VNTQTLCDLARERRSDLLREAAQARRARQSTSRRNAWRARLATALVATGETFLTLGASLEERSE